ncbi:BT4734/BF3469 family protein, partial [Hymenobacter cavernae]|uniref:BT4734/BF3469 family protein n=1 Tax=Hymenobacter cavernae TaxID=2044852 RepID=UPI00166E9200
MLTTQQFDELKNTINDALQPQFNYYESLRGNQPNEQLLTLSRVAEIIKSGTFIQQDDITNQIQQYRATGNKEEKEKLPVVAFAGQFQGVRSDASLKVDTYTGYLCLDYDHLEDVQVTKQRLLESKFGRYVKLAFVSPTGDGLKVVFEVDCKSDEHKACWKKLAELVGKELPELGTALDTQTANVSRGCFLSADTNVYYNPDADVYRRTSVDIWLGLGSHTPSSDWKAEYIKQEKERLPSVRVHQTDGNDQDQDDDDNGLLVVKTILEACQQQSRSITSSYNDWFAVANVVKGVVGDNQYALSIFDQFSRLDGSGYNPDGVRKLFRNIQQDRIQHGVGTLVLLAREAGVDLKLPSLVGTKKTRSQAAKPTDSKKVTQADIRDTVSQLYDIYYDKAAGNYYYAQAGEKNPFNWQLFTAKSTFLNELLGELEEYNVVIQKRKLEETLFNQNTYLRWSSKNRQWQVLSSTAHARQNHSKRLAADPQKIH